MQQKIREKLLGIYDLVLALGAIIIGIMMVMSNRGIFVEYPKEWISKVPFESWLIPGTISIVLFGIGNIIAAVFSFRKRNNKSWLASAIMGGILFTSIIVQVIMLGEWYLATIEFMILSIIQLCLSAYIFTYYRKNLFTDKQ